jgi:hypothetical protein
VATAAKPLPLPLPTLRLPPNPPSPTPAAAVEPVRGTRPVVLTLLPMPTETLTVTPALPVDAARLGELPGGSGRQPGKVGQGLSAALLRAQQELQRLLGGRRP